MARAEISGMGVAIVTAGAFLVYVGIRDVPVLEGLRAITSGHLPEGRERGADQASAVQAAQARLAAGTSGTSGTSGGTAQVGTGSTGLAAAALAYRGVPYVFGGTTRKGMDCSGLVQTSFADIGVKAPRTTYTQEVWTALRTISPAEAKSGDLVFWPGHVAVYIGGGQVVHAPKPGTVVRTEAVTTAGPPGTRPTYRRYVGGRQVVSV